MYELTMTNEQGASERTRHRTLAGVAAQIDTWSDPWRMDAMVCDGEGATLYYKAADELLAELRA